MTLSQAKQAAAKAGMTQVATAVGWLRLNIFGFANLKSRRWTYRNDKHPALVDNHRRVRVYPCR